MKTSIIILSGWAVTISSIVLQALYLSPLLTWFHYLSIFLASVLCGAMILDLKDIILGYLVVIPLSFFIMIFCLAALPGLTGKTLLTKSSLDLSVQYALVIVVRSTFPAVWIECLMAAILGGAIAEIFKITDVF